MTPAIERFQKLHLANLIGIIVVLILFALVVWLVILQFDLFGQIQPIPPEAEQIKTQIDFVQNYPLREESAKLQSIVPPAQEVMIQDLAPTEIGKKSPFE